MALATEPIAPADATNSNNNQTSAGQGGKKKYARMDVGELTPNNLNMLRRLNRVLLPIPYNDAFYTEALASGALSKYALFNDMFVGAMCCRREPMEGMSGREQVYILTLGILEPYRRLGLASMLLNDALTYAKSDKGLARIALHVRTDNEVARSFYERHGFRLEATVQDYYKDNVPSSAWLFVLELHHE